MKEEKHLTQIILFAIALAMSVAGVVLSILKAATPETTVLLLGIGLFCISLGAIDFVGKK
jgi:hypothetical protein